LSGGYPTWPKLAAVDLEGFGVFTLPRPQEVSPDEAIDVRRV